MIFNDIRGRADLIRSGDCVVCGARLNGRPLVSVSANSPIYLSTLTSTHPDLDRAKEAEPSPIPPDAATARSRSQHSGK